MGRRREMKTRGVEVEKVGKKRQYEEVRKEGRTEE